VFNDLPQTQYPANYQNDYTSTKHVSSTEVSLKMNCSESQELRSKAPSLLQDGRIDPRSFGYFTKEQIPPSIPASSSESKGEAIMPWLSVHISLKEM
jgi:hypothetical protein